MSGRSRGGRGRGRSPARSSSGRVLKKNSKYGEIQGPTFEKVVARLVGGPASDDDGSLVSMEEEEVKAENDEPRVGPDLGPDGVTHCIVCWSDCTPAPAAADAYNRLNRYLGSHGTAATQLVVGALGLDLDPAAKFELICHACAALVRLLEQKEQEAEDVRQKLLGRFQASRHPLPPAAEKQDPLSVEQQEPAGLLEQEQLEQELALQALRGDGQDGMFGIDGLAVHEVDGPPVDRHAARAARPAGSGAEHVTGGGGGAPLLAREEDTVEAYLTRRDEWIAQTPGASGGLVRAVVDASADGVSGRGRTVRTTTHPCCECERVFGSGDRLARHEYFQHGVGKLPVPAAGGGDGGGEPEEPDDGDSDEAAGDDREERVGLGAGDGDGDDEAGAEEASRDVARSSEDLAAADESAMEDSALDESVAGLLDDTSLGNLVLDAAMTPTPTPTPRASTGRRRRGRPRQQDAHALRSGECQYCGTFIKVDLQGHINRFHTMVRPHECGVCGVRLVSRHALAEHRQVAHSSGHRCQLCGASFARKKQLSVHQWRQHGVGGVQCRVCGKKFARSDTLDGHMRCHERPMQCSLCAARYPFKRELRNHEHLKHGLHGEIPRDSDHRPGEMYRCGKCGRCFGSWAGRDRHTCSSTAALSDLYVCQLCGDWSTRFEGDMVKHMRNLHRIEAETILIADVEDVEGDDGLMVQDGVEEADGGGADGGEVDGGGVEDGEADGGELQERTVEVATQQ